MPADPLPAVAAALQHYRSHLMARRMERPFDLKLVAEMERNWSAILWLRDQMHDYRPYLTGMEPVK